MIAPLREVDVQAAEDRRRMRKVRRLVGLMLLEHAGGNGPAAHPLAAWKAWALALWIVGAVLAYAAHMLGYLP